MHGERLEDGFHHNAPPGTFWKQPLTASGSEGDRGHHWHWAACTPDGVQHVLGLQHAVVEHDDGTITADPIPNFSDLNSPVLWHIRQGEWVSEIAASAEIPNHVPARSPEGLWVPR